MIPVTIFQFIMMTGNWFTMFMILFLLPVLLLWAYIMVWEMGGIFQSLIRTFSIISNNYGRVLSSFFIFYFTGILFYTLIDTGLLWFFFDVIGWNFSLDATGMDKLLSVLLAFTSVFFISLVFSVMAIGQGLQYYTLIQIEEAADLKKKIKLVGVSKQIQGIEKES